MGKAGTGGVVRLMQTLWDAGTFGSLDDAELLGRFLRRGAIAEAAFAALVRRHAPMVLRVCRDVTGDPHDAQDAAQATFVILAQKARFIRRPEALANWLFGTARRVAARARRDAVRRRRHERQYAETVAGRQASAATIDRRKWEWAGLYEELDRLPERYRVPIVLCDLESLTHEQAAATVGCPQRTLETRLYRGRERLRRRLVGRGLAPAVGLIGSALTAEARSVSVPTDWADSTALAVTRLVTGQAVATVVPAAVTSLIKEVNRAMFLNRLKWTATFAVITGLAAGLTLGLTRLTPGAGVQTNAKETRGGPSSSRQGPVGSEKKAKEGRETRPLARTADPARPAPTTAAITVSGRATDAVGKPVVGATIFLASTNVTDALLGTTTSDRDGKYTFREARLPVSRPQDDSPMSGTFAVYGRASGHGFAWHGMRFYLLQPRPAERLVSNEDYTIYQDEPMVMDLRFTAAATLSGRVMDEAGRPVPDAKIRVISCDFLDTEHKESHVNFREFWAIRTAPDAMTTTSTGRDGLFRLEGLPKEAGFRISVGHPDHAGLWLWAATTARPATAFNYPGQSIAPAQERPSVETGELTVTLHANRRIAVRTVYSDTGRPAPKVNVFAGQGAAGAAAGGTSDADGKLLLRLPPGQYNVTADPTDLSANFIRTRSTLRVTGEPAEQSLEVRVNPGCVLFLEVVDAKTGAGIPGVTFMYEMDDRPGARAVVQSRTGYIDNPRSDAKGRLRAVVDPGERVYALGQIPESAGYAQQSMQKRVTLPAGKTVTVRFALRK